jgi:hypothetical protein
MYTRTSLDKFPLSGACVDKAMRRDPIVKTIIGYKCDTLRYFSTNVTDTVWRRIFQSVTWLVCGAVLASTNLEAFPHMRVISYLSTFHSFSLSTKATCTNFELMSWKKKTNNQAFTKVRKCTSLRDSIRDRYGNDSFEKKLLTDQVSVKLQTIFLWRRVVSK